MKSMDVTDGLKIRILSVEVKSQHVINGTKDGLRSSTETYLEGSTNVGLVVIAIINGIVSTTSFIPTDFSFSDIVTSTFNNHYSDYTNSIQSDSTISSALAGQNARDPEDVEQQNNFNLYIYIGCSVAGCVLVAFLIVLFINKKTRRSGRVTLSSTLTFQDENEFIRSQGIGVQNQNHMMHKAAMNPAGRNIPQIKSMGSHMYSIQGPNRMGEERHNMPLAARPGTWQGSWHQGSFLETSNLTLDQYSDVKSFPQRPNLFTTNSINYSMNDQGNIRRLNTIENGFGPDPNIRAVSTL